MSFKEKAPKIGKIGYRWELKKFEWWFCVNRLLFLNKGKFLRIQVPEATLLDTCVNSSFNFIELVFWEKTFSPKKYMKTCSSLNEKVLKALIVNTRIRKEEVRKFDDRVDAHLISYSKMQIMLHFFLPGERCTRNKGRVRWRKYGRSRSRCGDDTTRRSKFGKVYLVRKLSCKFATT